jgi:hypothetical protein
MIRQALVELYGLSTAARFTQRVTNPEAANNCGSKRRLIVWRFNRRF